MFDTPYATKKIKIPEETTRISRQREVVIAFRSFLF
jgi:hypothetical protein